MKREYRSPPLRQLTFRTVPLSSRIPLFLSELVSASFLDIPAASGKIRLVVVGRAVVRRYAGSQEAQRRRCRQTHEARPLRRGQRRLPPNRRRRNKSLDLPLPAQR